LISAYWFHFG